MMRYPVMHLSSLAPRFCADMPDRPVLGAVLAGNVSGQAIVDDLQRPAWGLLKCSAWNCAFVFGQPPAHSFNSALESLAPKGRVGVVVWEGNAAQLDPSPFAVRRIVPRFEFAEPVAIHGFRSFLSLCPEGCLVQRMDASLIPRCSWRDLYVGTDGTAERFLMHGVGFCLTKGTNVLSEACGIFVAENQAEIGAITRADHRGRNFAGIVTAHLIDHCLAQGIQPIWSCDRHHKESMSVAKKLGFRKVREYEHRYYRTT